MTFSKTIAVLMLLLATGHIRSVAQLSGLDVTHYDVFVEPDIQERSVRGSVTIRYRLPADRKSFVFGSGDLEVVRVSGPNVEGFDVEGNRLTIRVSGLSAEFRELEIEYQGHPSRGLTFDQEGGSAHTAFFTEQWMVVNDDPGDKATVSMSIAVPDGLECISNGLLVKVEDRAEKQICHWRQDVESPAYTFGFAIGKFQKHRTTRHGVGLYSYASDYSAEELTRIFRVTDDMLAFFEDVSGVEYDQATYSQVLIGERYQEASGWSALKADYGRMVLEDSTETNLISHELAHQWWGNRITCRSWNHFWLNEAFATFMSAAYNEHRFGREKYDSDIDSYRRVYEDIALRGGDRSLIFGDWSNPTRDERNLVYFKGAYVLHRLRLAVGDDAFWAGIRHYSRVYFDDVVETEDFRRAMEESTGMDLGGFFQEWIYVETD